MPLGIGEYQPGYNPKIHGAYDPSRYYGKADPLSKVKLGELSQWMGRRDVSPLGAWRVVQRGWHHWMNNWMHVKRPTTAPLIQAAMLGSLVFYLSMYHPFSKYHKHCKYH